MSFPKSPTEHERNVRALPCIVSGGKSTFHHAQGPSINARLRELGLPTKGYGERGNGPALVLPLAAHLHFFGPEGIDVGGMSRGEWETKYGSQAEMIDRVGTLLGYNLWDLHRLWLVPSKILPRRL
jgi:hypothetical protein